MLTKRTLLAEIRVENIGVIRLRIYRQILDGDEVVSRVPHPFPIAPGENIDTRVSDLNAHLAAMGWPQISDYQAVKDHAAVAWTPEVIAAYQAQSEDA